MNSSSSNIRAASRQCRYGSEAEVERITGFSRRTLQKDRLLNRARFPWYKVGGKILYDLDEVEKIIRGCVRGSSV